MYVITIITTDAVPGYCDSFEISVSFGYGLRDGGPLCADAQVVASIFNIASYFEGKKPNRIR